MKNLSEKVKEYRIVDILSPKGAKTTSTNSDWDGLPYVTVELQEEGDKPVFMASNTLPFVTIVGRNNAMKKKIELIEACRDESGKADPNKLNDLGVVRGLFARFGPESGVEPYWQTYKDKDGKQKYRKYGDNHPDKGEKIPAATISMFVFEQDLVSGNIRSVIRAAMSGRRKIQFEDLKNAQYQSDTAWQILKDVQGMGAEAAKAVEGAVKTSEPAEEDEDVVA